MDLIKVIGIGIIGSLLAATLKNWKNEFHIYVVLGSGLIMLIFILYSISDVISSFFELIENSNFNTSLFSGIFKIIGIGYLTEYSASICSDAGAQSIASKIELGGKITIFLMAFPIIKALIDVLNSLIV